MKFSSTYQLSAVMCLLEQNQKGINLLNSYSSIINIITKMNGKKLGSDDNATDPKLFLFDNEFMDEPEDNQSENHSSSGDQLIVKIPSRGQEEQEKKTPLKPDKQRKRVKKIKKEISQLNINISELKERYKDFDYDEIMFRKRDLKKEAEVKEFIRQQRREKKRRDRRMNKIRQKQNEKVDKSFVKKEEDEKGKIQQRVEDQMKKFIKHREMQKVQKQADSKIAKEVQQMYEKIYAEEKKKKKFHLRKQAEDRRKSKKRKQKQKQYLLKRKEIYKPFVENQFEEHEKKYEQKKSQLMAGKLAEKQKQYLQILEKNNKFDEMFRGHSYDHAVDEFEGRRQKRQQPKQMYKKVKNYQEYVRENFVPKSTEKPNRKSMEIDLSRKENLSQRQVKRYRFLKGVSLGQITQHRPLVKSEIQQRKMGNEYMDFMLNLPKKPKVQEPPKKQNQIQALDKKYNHIMKARAPRMPTSNLNRKSLLEVKVSDKPTRDEVSMVIDQLKSHDEKIRLKEKLVNNEEHGLAELTFKHKQMDGEIVENMERKLSLLGKLAK